jgi:FlaG/FlaF family flagellin (archaellin)
MENRITKKSLSPVIATVLLVIVAVVSVVSFMSWFNSQSSELQAKASVEADGIGRELQVYVGGTGNIYLTNLGTKSISVTAVAASVAGNSCTLNSYIGSIAKGITNTDTKITLDATCKIKDNVEILVTTDKGIVSRTAIIG